MKKYKKVLRQEEVPACKRRSVVCGCVLEREREREKKLRSALPCLKVASAIRYFTNFICKDKNRRRTSRPYALLKNKNISNTSFFHTPLFKVTKHPQSLILTTFFKRTGTRNTHPCRIFFFAHFSLEKPLKRRHVRVRQIRFRRNIFIRT